MYVKGSAVQSFSAQVLTDPSVDQLGDAISKFLHHSGQISTLHHVAATNLRGTAFDLSDPFPRLENHGSYLFGELATPTSLNDGADLFISISYVLSFKNALVIARSPEGDEFREDTEEFLETLEQRCSSVESVGEFVASLLGAIAENIEEKVLKVHRSIDRDLSRLTDSFDIHNKDLTAEEISALYLAASRYRIDVLGVRTTIEETTRILDEISNDRIDLRASEQPGLELFSRDLEILVHDLHIRFRRLTALRNNLESTIKVTFDKFERLDDQSQTKASNNMAAIASIMLLPSFLVGFFGQNFGIYDEIEYHWGWALSMGAIALVTAGQIVFFRRKRWL